MATSRRTRIKICGITNVDDLREAVRLGADAIGFIGVRASPRYVAPAKMRLLYEELLRLSPFTMPVLVVKNVVDSLAYDFVGAVQFYEGNPAVLIDSPHRYVRVFRVGNEDDLAPLRADGDSSTASAYLLDTLDTGHLGGSGRPFDWVIAQAAVRTTNMPVLLAGGLTAGNVAEAIRIVKPYGVDVSSGVEKSPGMKDHTKMASFIRAVRLSDAEFAN